MTDGLHPYRWAPWPLELFWSLLLPLDLVVIVLLAVHRTRTALLLATAIMIADVAANSYALFGLGAPPSARLLMQTAFLGFVVGATGVLWPAPPPPTTPGQEEVARGRPFTRSP